MSKFLLLFIIFTNSVSSLASETIILLDYNCPYFCNQKETKQKGYVLEILNQFFKEQNKQLKIKVLPYQRIFQELPESDKNISVLPLIDINNHSRLKSFTTSIGINFSAIAVKSTDNFTYIGIEDLKGKNVVIKSGGLEAKQVRTKLKALNLGVDKTINITGPDSGKRMLKMLALDRADIVVSDYNSLSFLVGIHKVKNIDIKPVALTRFTPMFITFEKPPKDFKKLNTDFTKFMKNMRTSGKLKSILDNYNIEDWKRFVVR